MITNFKVVFTRLQENFEKYYEELRLYKERQELIQKGYYTSNYELPEFSSGRLYKEVGDLESCFATAFKNF